MCENILNPDYQEFMSIYNSAIHRPGSVEFLDWLQSTDFFTAPASTRFHLCVEGGLLKHSIHVYKRLKKLYEAEYGEVDAETHEKIAIIGLLHDVCKANFYGVEMRNKKDANGRWIQVPYYTVVDQFPYGHGEKSALLVSRYMNLSDEEMMSIRWHMGFSDNDFLAGGKSINSVFEKYPMAVLTHIADLQATCLDESSM